MFSDIIHLQTNYYANQLCNDKSYFFRILFRCFLFLWEALQTNDKFVLAYRVACHLTRLASDGSQGTSLFWCWCYRHFSAVFLIHLLFHLLSAIAGTQVWITRWTAFDHRNDTCAVRSSWRFAVQGCIFFCPFFLVIRGLVRKPDSLSGQKPVWGLLKYLNTNWVWEGNHLGRVGESKDNPLPDVSVLLQKFQLQLSLSRYLFILWKNLLLYNYIIISLLLTITIKI